MALDNTGMGEDLDALLGMDAPDTGTQPADNANQSKTQTWNAGGRTWNKPEDLAKAYDSLVRDYSKTKQSLKKGEEWTKFGSWLDQNPDLRTDLQRRIEEYQKNKQGGMSTPAAAKDAGISKEYADRIERMEAQYADLLLDREVEALKNKYKVGDDELKDVLKFAYDNEGISLETAYKAVAYEKQMLQSQEAGRRGALANVAKKKAANVGPSSHSPITPNAANRKLTGKEHEAQMAQKLEQFGFKD